MIKALLARLLPAKNHFHGGLHITPPRHKSMSTGAPSREAALSAEYAISLRQRDGSAYLAKVAPGERVLRGQLLAEPVNSQDAPVHAPTSGTIRAIEPRPEMHPANLPVPHLILESDGKDEAVPPLPTLDPETTDADTLRERIAACGIVGLGGAGFPTARKLGHPANTLVINAAECEPYITCDDLQIRENAADIIHGAQIAAKILGAEHIHFGIEDDKPQAIAALERAAADIADPRIQISSVPTRYPSGNARQLFELLLGVRVPADKHASDYGLICHNSGTMKAVYDAVIRGEPLTERYTTISGEGVKQPQVLRIRTGAPARDLIAQAGGEKGDNRYIIGGPMMGYEIASINTPLQKTGNSLLLLPAIAPAEESPCIRCSRCADACPMELLPQQLLWYSQSDEHKRLKQYRLFDCIECGICAAVCPSAIPLVQYYRHSKGAIRAADDKTRAAEHARARHEARTARLEREAAERQAQMDARRAKLQQNPAADKPERYTPAKETTASPTDITPPSVGQGQGSPANHATASPNIQPPPPVGEGRGGGSQQNNAAPDDKTTAIEAAKARAAARRAERLAAQNSETAAPHQLPPDPGKTTAIEATKARAAARRAERLSAQNSETATPHQQPPTDDKTTAIEAAKARAAARRAERLAAQNEKTGTSTAPTSRTEVLPPSQDAPASAAGEGWGGGSALHSGTNTETSTNTAPAPHQLPPDPGKTAAIEAAKARAAARRAERLAAQNEKTGTSTAPTSRTEVLPPSQDALASAAGEGWGGGSDLHFGTNVETSTNDKTAAIEAAKARAAARRTERLAAQNSETAAPHQLPPDPGKTAAIEAAKARAAARKAARLAQQPLNQEISAQHPLTPPQLSRTTRELSQSPTGGGSAAVAEPPTAAAFPADLPPSSPRGGGDGGGVRPHTADANTATDAGRPFMADNNNVGHECPTYDPVTTDPAPHQLPPDPDKTAAIEAAKARAAARKAARLAQQPLNQETSAQHPLTPPQLSRTTRELSQSPTGGGSAPVAEPPTAAASPVALPPSPRGGGDGGGVSPHTADANTATDAGRPFMADNNNVGHECPTYDPVTTDPAPHQLPPDPGKTAAIEAAKARAAARKAAHLAQQPLNEKTSAQHPLTPPHPSPTGGGSLSVAEPPTATPHPENNKQPETPMNPNDTEQEKQSRDAKLAAARAKSAERRIAHAKLKQHMRDTAVPIRPQPDDRK